MSGSASARRDDWLSLCASPNSINWAHASIDRKDVEALLGEATAFGDEMSTLAHIMHASKLFRSVSEARRNGWNKPIEHGVHGYRVGKYKRVVFVFKVYDADVRGRNDP